MRFYHDKQETRVNTNEMKEHQIRKQNVSVENYCWYWIDVCFRSLEENHTTSPERILERKIQTFNSLRKIFIASTVLFSVESNQSRTCFTVISVYLRRILFVLY